MTATAHALIAAGIAAKIPNPLIALPLSFLSNFLTDLVPHWDFGFNWRKKKKVRLFLEVAFDVALGYFLLTVIYLVYFSRQNSPSFLFVVSTALAGQLPDFLEAPYLLLNLNFPVSKFMYKIQHRFHSRLALPWGLLTQVLFVLVFLYFSLGL